MRGGWAFVLIVMWLVTGCYATTSTPPGPNCIVDSTNPACLQPIHDKTKPDAGASK